MHLVNIFTRLSNTDNLHTTYHNYSCYQNGKIPVYYVYKAHSYIPPA